MCSVSSTLRGRTNLVPLVPAASCWSAVRSLPDSPPGAVPLRRALASCPEGNPRLAATPHPGPHIRGRGKRQFIVGDLRLRPEITVGSSSLSRPASISRGPREAIDSPIHSPKRDPPCSTRRSTVASMFFGARICRVVAGMCAPRCSRYPFGSLTRRTPASPNRRANATGCVGGEESDIFEEQPPAGREPVANSLKRGVAVGDVFENCSCVDEVERICGQVVDQEVVSENRQVGFVQVRPAGVSRGRWR